MNKKQVASDTNWFKIANERNGKYKTLEDLQTRINQYFEFIKGEYTIVGDFNKRGDWVESKIWLREPEPPTITGLTLYLGYADKSSLHKRVRDENPENFYRLPIKKALTLIEQSYEKGIRGSSAAGCIFALKNMKWTDKQEHELKGEVKISGMTIK